MSPRHAKSLSGALSKAIEGYEKKYGPIIQSPKVEHSITDDSDKTLTLELENH